MILRKCADVGNRDTCEDGMLDSTWWHCTDPEIESLNESGLCMGGCDLKLGQIYTICYQILPTMSSVSPLSILILHDFSTPWIFSPRLYVENNFVSFSLFFLPLRSLFVYDRGQGCHGENFREYYIAVV